MRSSLPKVTAEEETPVAALAALLRDALTRCKAAGSVVCEDLVDEFVTHVEAAGVPARDSEMADNLRSARDIAQRATVFARTPDRRFDLQAVLPRIRLDVGYTMLGAAVSMCDQQPSRVTRDILEGLEVEVCMLEEFVFAQNTDPAGFDFQRACNVARVKQYAQRKAREAALAKVKGPA